MYTYQISQEAKTGTHLPAIPVRHGGDFLDRRPKREEKCRRINPQSGPDSVSDLLFSPLHILNCNSTRFFTFSILLTEPTRLLSFIHRIIQLTSRCVVLSFLWPVSTPVPGRPLCCRCGQMVNLGWSDI